ncbi:outer membrane protein [Sphingobacterium nematocida]|uniref:Outer membrane protein n=1 Tax=Sphingobacterium nematocida TaxID=1513896 RepID=A0A1T5GKP2_9SPHI|nr:TolC family protein [Sphingobacterium nematocida]SKC08982.1 outer membrane protein [Sphingobacterium nematocida]
MKIVSKIIAVVCLFFGHNAFAQKKWTLEECVSYAIENNVSIGQIELDNKLAEIDKKDAFGSFLPNVNASASHSWNRGLNTNITTGILENQTTQFTSMGASLGVDIFKGMQNQNRFRKSKLALISSQYQHLKMEEDVALNVVNAYLQVLFNKETVKVQREQFNADSLQLLRSEVLVDAGMIPRGDLFDMKATVATDKQRIIEAEYALLIAKMSLAQLLQMKDFKDFEIADVEYDFQNSAILLEGPESIYRKAKNERTELKIAENNVKIAEKDIDIAKGAHLPSLTGFYGFSSRVSYAKVPDGQGGVKNPPSFFEQFDLYKGHNFGLQLNVPIFNGFLIRNNVTRSKVNLDKSKLALAQTELDLERNIYTAYADAKGALETYLATKEMLKAREEAFRYTKERYENGMATGFDYNQSQTLLVNTQSDLLRTKYDYLFRTRILEFYFGIPIIKREGMQLN